MAIYWDKAVLLSFRLCCFSLCRLNCLCSFPTFFLGQDVEFDCVGSRADPGFLNRGFKLAEGGSISAVRPIFPEIPHENEII